MRLVAAALLLVLAPGMAVASQVLFSQTPVDGADGFLADRSQTCCPLADDFRLAGPSTVTELKWWGSYFGNLLQNDNFQIALYRDAIARGSTPFISFSGEVSRTATALHETIGGVIYEYSFQLATPLELDRDITYFFSVSNERDGPFGDNGLWFWQSAMAESFWFRDRSLNWVQDSRGQGLAFQVIGVPEPATLLLLACGIMCLSVRRRARLTS